MTKQYERGLSCIWSALQNETADAKLTGLPAYADRRQSWIDGRSAGSEAVLIWNDETSVVTDVDISISTVATSDDVILCIVIFSLSISTEKNLCKCHSKRRIFYLYQLYTLLTNFTYKYYSLMYQ